MTFNSAAWAIDGALLNASLARAQTYANSSGQEGVVQRTDLKVTALDVPGIGVKIATGSALILNRYQGSGSSQMYTVENSGVHVVLPEAMPPSSPTPKSYIVAIAVGDPEFSQSGHPFMLASDPPQGQESTFTYVRPVLIEVGSNTATTLGNVFYPALPLARIDVPANTTTITSGMITDLRKIARPRTKMELNQVKGNTPGWTTKTTVALPSYGKFPGAPLAVTIPTWATRMKVVAIVEGLRLVSASKTILRLNIEGTAIIGDITNAYEDVAVTSSYNRRTYAIGADLDVSSVAGQTKNLIVQGSGYSAADIGKMESDGASSVIYQVYFEETPI